MSNLFLGTLVLSFGLTSLATAESIDKICADTAMNSPIHADYKVFAWNESDPKAKDIAIQQQENLSVLNEILQSNSSRHLDWVYQYMGALQSSMDAIREHYDPEIAKFEGEKREAAEAAKKMELTNGPLETLVRISHELEMNAMDQTTSSRYAKGEQITFGQSAFNTMPDGKTISLTKSVRMSSKSAKSYDLHFTDDGSGLRLEICPSPNNRSNDFCTTQVFTSNKGYGTSYIERKSEAPSGVSYVKPSETFLKFLQGVPNLKSTDPVLYECLVNHPKSLDSSFDIVRQVLKDRVQQTQVSESPRVPEWMSILKR